MAMVWVESTVCPRPVMSMKWTTPPSVHQQGKLTAGSQNKGPTTGGVI
jgi:hypothetical protein